MSGRNMPLRDEFVCALTRDVALQERHLFFELNPDIPYPPILKEPVREAKPASVLIPIRMHPQGPAIVMTVRPATMPSHPGEICFPGGGPKAEDRTPVDTALREAEEELGIPKAEMDVVGTLGPHFGGLGFVVTPVVGLIRSDVPICPCEREVDDVFEVPLSAARARTRHIIETRHRNNIDYRMFAFPFHEGTPPRHIWGLTAGILDTLSRALNGTEDRP
ncbi:MAG: NUDIX hydrolase [Parvularcula sp.]